MPEWRIGTIGFAYDDWRDVFYPPDLKPSGRLAFYARHFDTVEVDATFHATPPAERFERWAEAVPAGFRFCLKAPRAVTHDAPTPSDALEPMRAFLDASRGLGERRGVVLLQYPPTLPARAWPAVARFLDALPTDVRYAVEFRDGSWFTDAIYAELRRRDVALVAAEYGDPPRVPVATADFAFVRWVGVHERYEPMNFERYDPTERLTWWRDRLAGLRGVRTVWGFANNDYAGFSVATADRMRRLVGLSVADERERRGTLF